MWVYQLLIRLLLPVVTVYLIFTIKQQKTGKLKFITQRLGINYNSIFITNPIWIHCASVGEVKSVERLIKHIAKRQPILITTNTITGKKLANKLFKNLAVNHQYCPYDIPIFIKNFINTHKPSQLWVVETEIWANLFQQCYQHNIPITILNARLSKKTLRAPKWLKKTYIKTLQKVTKVLASSTKEANNFKYLGVNAEKIKVLGNLKYSGLTNINYKPHTITRQFVLLASSHAGEELAIAKIWYKLKRKELLIIVPRHPKRSKKIIADLANYKDNLAIYSLNQNITATTKIYLFDVIGKLIPLFSQAKLVIMGGSFVNKGGHNMLEPAALKAPIVIGADVSHFTQEAQLLKQFSGIKQYTSYAELEQQLPKLLANKQQLLQMGINAHKAVLTKQYIFNDYLKELDFSKT